MNNPRYLEDLKLNDQFLGPTYHLTADEIVKFALTYDPQSFHTEPEKAADSFFGQHVASGWQVASLGMRLLVLGEHNFAGGMIGLGVERIRWKRPTLPNTDLKMVSTITELRRSGKFPKHGIVKLHHVIKNAKDETELAEMDTIQIVLLKTIS